jgi:hypothetical protein
LDLCRPEQLKGSFCAVNTGQFEWQFAEALRGPVTISELSNIQRAISRNRKSINSKVNEVFIV